MKTALTLSLLLTVFAGLSAFGQRDITNADLEKFRVKRVQAEREYRNNYEKMGFPSPEELQRQLEKSMADRFALAERLASDEMERERIAIDRERVGVERENLALQRETMWARQQELAYSSTVYGGYYGSGYSLPGFNIYRGRYRNGIPFAPRVNFWNGSPQLSSYPTPVYSDPRVRINNPFGRSIRTRRR